MAHLPCTPLARAAGAKQSEASSSFFPLNLCKLRTDILVSNILKVWGFMTFVYFNEKIEGEDRFLNFY